MRAVSLWQPWASAIACGSKRIETRHWATSYRGPLAIHAAARCHKGELLQFRTDRKWIGALHLTVRTSRLECALPFGALLATCELKDCVPTEEMNATPGDPYRLTVPRRPMFVDAPADVVWTEWDMGNFLPGRFGWVLENIVPLPQPVAFKGRQGFFEVPDHLLTEAALP